MTNKEKIQTVRLELNSTLRKANKLQKELEELKTNSPTIHDEIKKIVDKLNKKPPKYFSNFVKKGNKIIAYLKDAPEVGTYRDRDGVPTKYGLPEWFPLYRQRMNKIAGGKFIKTNGKSLGNGKGFVLEIAQSYLKSKNLV